jgi:hypothetical protein
MSLFGAPFGERLLAEVSTTQDVGSLTVHATIRVENSYKTTIDFSVRERTYTFVVTRWQGSGFSKFFQLFHEHEPRDAAMYGGITLYEDMPALKPGTGVEQKTNAVVKAAHDVLACLNKILLTHGRGVLDYAVWYREKHGRYDTYSAYITTVTCHCIVHTDFLAPAVRWDLVEF